MRKTGRSGEVVWGQRGGIVAAVVAVVAVVLIAGGVVAEASAAGTAPAVAPGPEAAGWQGLDEVADGRLLLRTRTPGRFVASPRQGTHAEVHVSGPVARTVVTQRFRNPLDHWLEAVYVFPLPAGAAVDDLEILIGDRHLRAEIREKVAARAEWEEAAADGRAATLVERIRPGLFRNAVANIPPRAEVVVRLSWQQTLSFDGRRWQMRFPTAVLPGSASGAWGELGERRAGGAAHGAGGNDAAGAAGERGGAAEARQVVPAQPARGRQPRTSGQDPFSVEVLLAPGAPLAAVRSPSHRIRRRRLADERFRVELARGREPAGRDFVLEWETRAADSALAWSLHEETPHGAYQLVAIPPFAREDAEECAPHLPGETIFLTDISGSMAGAPLRAARRALGRALRLLPAGERVEMVAFDHKVHRWQARRGSLPLTEPTREEALAWVSSLEPSGGTEILGALEDVLATPAPAGAHSRVVLLTDGGASFNRARLQRIEAALGERRVFVIGLGPAPEGWLLERIATLGRGRLHLVSEAEDLPLAVERSVGRGAAPLLRDLELVVTADSSVEIWPDRLPDLFAGETVFVHVRGAAGEQRLQVRGRCAGAVRDIPLREGGSAQGVARAFGAARVKSLEALHDEYGLAEADRAFVREEALSTALRHGIVSRFTSLVAVDDRPLRPEDAELRALRKSAPLPEGWRVPASFRTGWVEDAPWHLANADELVASKAFRTAEERAVALGVATGLGTRRQVGLALILLPLAWVLLRSGRWREALACGESAAVSVARGAQASSASPLAPAPNGKES